MTPADTTAGAAALKAYVQSVDGLEAFLVTEADYEAGANVVIQQWDSLGPMTNPNSEAMGRASCGDVLYQDITEEGYSSAVTAQQCMAGADAVINAVVAGRGPATPTAKPPTTTS